MAVSITQTKLSRCLAVGFAALILSSCASFFNPEPNDGPDQAEDEVTQMERYVKCLRDKDRKVEDPPCLLE